MLSGKTPAIYVGRKHYPEKGLYRGNHYVLEPLDEPINEGKGILVRIHGETVPPLESVALYDTYARFRMEWQTEMVIFE